MTTNTTPTCCLTAFPWTGTPSGRESTLANVPAYVAGDSPTRALLFIHDLFGWTFPNIRLLADSYAKALGVTVYVPDFFGGEVMAADKILAGRFDELDMPGFLARNGREVREGVMFDCARELRGMYQKLGAVGYCYGAWAVFRLGAGTSTFSASARGDDAKPLVDAIVAGHPSLLTEDDIKGVTAPTQILAPEFDPVFTRHLKSFAFQTLQDNKVPFEYCFFPEVEHACFVRGDPNKAGEREAMEKGLQSAVGWFSKYLATE